MLDYFAIISTGGLILWHYMPPGVAPLSGSPVNKLISEQLSKVLAPAPPLLARLVARSESRRSE